ncbi:endonuclease/exonuclease/phosphatase family protein [Neptunicoccus cionae]|uniref:Endonuclease n=1 Tax=Neptunicoccus cionae TaxID=2035344 RepID=A0A916VQB7_9RHOB|nr:endonuclease/exonuclease/phosphatase family protein [Amylibacter cionae]GGA19458.1 endonuclease [Amylibacter cionae]
MRFLPVVALCLTGLAAAADPIRIATFNAALSRKGPGLLLRDIEQGNDAQIKAVIAILQTVRPDILLINELDHDHENLTLQAFLRRLAQDTEDGAALDYPYYYAPAQNTGLPSGRDLDGDGRLGGPADNYGFGYFRGQYAMALVSRFPLDTEKALDFSDLLWKHIPNAEMPKAADGSAFPSYDALHAMRLSSKSHWDVPVVLPDGRRLHLLASHPTPPVFDGPEDMNGKRNRAEILFWDSYIRETLLPTDADFVLLGDLNADPADGEGSHDAINTLLSAEYIQDPEPRSKGGALAAQAQAGVNAEHQSDPATDTADWNDSNGPGNLRVDYVLPSAALNVSDAGVFWPAPDTAGFEWIGSDGRASSDHRLVWIDID